MKGCVQTILGFLLFMASCSNNESIINGSITNSQIFYRLESSHSFPRIQFHASLHNLSSDTISIILEDRAYAKSQLSQFFWIFEEDTLMLMCNVGWETGKVTVSPDSSIKFQLRTDLSKFLEENKTDLGDSTYYKSVLHDFSTRGDIFFKHPSYGLIEMKRKKPFGIVYGYTNKIIFEN